MIRLSELLGVPPRWTAEALKCPEEKVERLRKEFRHDLQRHDVLFHASEPAHERLRARYRQEGGLGTATKETWSGVLNEARKELVERVVSAFLRKSQERDHRGLEGPRYVRPST
jgi:hypothetical protein